MRTTTQVAAPAEGPTADYGKYLATIGDCFACHGAQLAGGPFPDPAVTMSVPNLTKGGELANWTEQDFVNAMRTGVVPGGRKLDPVLMPWPEFAIATDDELKAIWSYLQSVPRVETPAK